MLLNTCLSEEVGSGIDDKWKSVPVSIRRHLDEVRKFYDMRKPWCRDFIFHEESDKNHNTKRSN